MEQINSAEQGAASADENGPTYVVLAISLAVYWGISGLVLWWLYDVSPLIRGGYYEQREALVLVTKMGLIITALTSTIWLVMNRRKMGGAMGLVAWKVAWRTSLVLIGYTALILARRQFAGSPAPDSAFLPIVGHVNSYFFSEALFLIFLLEVAPIMGCISGVLYSLQVRTRELLR